MSLLAPTCRYEGCGRPVVGSSVRGEGHVCRAHNEREWGEGLVRSGYWPEMGGRLIAGSGVE